jgi:amino acid transporter
VLTFLWGLENLVVAMLPLRFLDGPKVRVWSRAAWASLLFLGIVGVVHVLLAPTAGYVGHTTGEVTVGVLVVFAIFCAISVGTWAYFRYRPRHWATR